MKSLLKTFSPFVASLIATVPLCGQDTYTPPTDQNDRMEQQDNDRPDQERDNLDSDSTDEMDQQQDADSQDQQGSMNESGQQTPNRQQQNETPQSDQSRSNMQRPGQDGQRVQEMATVGGQFMPTANGAYVNSVYTGGPLDKQGVQTGDVIVSLNGQQVRSGQEIDSILRELKSGDSVSVSIMRGGQSEEKQIELISREELMRVSNPQQNPDIAERQMQRPNTMRNNYGVDVLQRVDQRLADMEREIQNLRRELKQMRDTEQQRREGQPNMQQDSSDRDREMRQNSDAGDGG